MCGIFFYGLSSHCFVAFVQKYHYLNTGLRRNQTVSKNWVTGESGLKVISFSSPSSLPPLLLLASDRQERLMETNGMV